MHINWTKTFASPIWFRTISGPLGQLIFGKPQTAILGFREEGEMLLIAWHHSVWPEMKKKLRTYTCCYDLVVSITIDYHLIYIHLNILLYICLSIRWYASQPFYPYTYLVAHLTLIWKHAAICKKTTLETTFKSYIKKNFKYIPKHASFYQISDPK